MPWDEADGWAEDVFDVLDALAALIGAGHADAVVGLAEFAFSQIESAMDDVDDSSSGVLRALSERAGEIHLRACDQARPDPVELARRLVSLELSSELDGLYDAAPTHADVLGPTGLAEYRRVLTAVHQRDPHASRSARSALVSVLQELGEVDELIELLRHDAGSDDQLAIVDALVGANRFDEAIEWSQGIVSDPDQRVGPELRDRLASMLRKDGKTAEALRLYVDLFKHAPSLANYQTLLAQPEADLAEWYEPCLTVAREWTEARSAGDTKNPKLYEPAIDLIERIRTMCKQLDDMPGFDSAVLRARTEHRPKRNVQKLLDARGW